MNRALIRMTITGILACHLLTAIAAQNIVTVRPTPIDDILTDPGIGFMTFQRFNKNPAGHWWKT